MKESYLDRDYKDLSVMELLKPYEVSQEFLEWTEKWFNRGRLRLDHLRDITWLREIKFRHFIALHELGHLRLAQRFGWRIREVVTNATGRAYGWVKMSPPVRWTRETIRQWGIILMGGNASTGSEFGTSSDFKQAETASNILNFPSRGTFLSEARIMVGQTEILDDKAWGYQTAA